MGKIFITQEIGSIQRPIWRQNLEAAVNPQWIRHALLWGERLGVQERFELANDSGSGILQKDGKERSAQEKNRIIEIASIYVIRMLERAGLDRVFNGEQPRTEMYDFLAKVTGGIEPAGQINSFDANYFRKGTVNAPVAIKGEGVGFFANEFSFVREHTKKAVKPCLTGPYTMSDWSFLEYYKRGREAKGEQPKVAMQQARRDAVLDFAKNVLNPIVLKLAQNGASVIQIDEPAASTNEGESELFVEAINECFRGVPGNVERAVHMCYGNYPSLFPALAQCRADSYLIEFTNHAPKNSFSPQHVSLETFRAIELFREYGMGASIGVGVVDIHSDLVESAQVIKERLLYAAKIIGEPARVQVNPDCGLRTRRWHVAFAKLCNMAEGAQLARAEFGE